MRCVFHLEVDASLDALVVSEVLGRIKRHLEQDRLGYNDPSLGARGRDVFFTVSVVKMEEQQSEEFRREIGAPKDIKL